MTRQLTIFILTQIIILTHATRA